MPRAKRTRNKRDLRRNTTHAETTTCAPDLEPLLQERREAIHTAAAMGASPTDSGSDTELSQLTSNHHPTPDSMSEPGLARGPSVTPATADKLF
ncbi:hypothetical protein NDU88_005978 [Pleurodeles waltl]|uniref:Uncharacterized protein n=1 Tax=Pleurodeles waltl TaxID=8319 RepID=A0AAV7TX36_PLEWA|nr:hypothetical protein NDU88_005978 [Pleurodeles waltl]